MTEGRSLASTSMTDYEAIEAAVMETERGRWFLREYARRNRNADTEVLLKAITHLEQVILGQGLAHDRDRLKATLREMAREIALTREEAGELRKLETWFAKVSDSEPLFDVVRVSKDAALMGRRAAADIREAATALQSSTPDKDLLRGIERSSAEVETAFDQAEAGTRTVERIVSTLRLLETRIQEMLSPEKARDPARMPPRLDATSADTKSASTADKHEAKAQDDSPRQPHVSGIAPGGSKSSLAGAIQVEQQDSRKPPDVAQNRDAARDAGDIEAVERAAAGIPEGASRTPSKEPTVRSPIPQPLEAVSSREVIEPRRNPMPEHKMSASPLRLGNVPSPSVEPAPPLQPRPAFRREVFAEIDRLSTRERLRLFT
ncbi:hypothetical protein [Microvirga massiliensis]|uniref:hypothetical protein n=1 Tax=Microvirga massiliensis TaxID=1033741 RepID=UPI00065FA469|nr:hypothetical protein [Microvirga massiliensis]